VEINFTEFFTIITQDIDFFALYLFGHDHKFDLRIIHLFHEVNIYDAFFAERTENGRFLVFGETLDMDVMSAPHGPVDKYAKISINTCWTKCWRTYPPNKLDNLTRESAIGLYTGD
jgi:hypothetical protein